MLTQAEYIWIDGAKPVSQLRCKTRVLQRLQHPTITDFPVWNFDGSSTYQSEGGNSDLNLQPVNFVKDPIRGEGHYLVLCEVMDDHGKPHASNARAELRRVLDAGGSAFDPWFGFEQEYTLFQDGRPLGWPETGYPAPQGPFYCAVGTGNVFGRPLVESHAEACMAAGIQIYGVNAEVMPAQWEYQVGPRGIAGERCDPLHISDHLWLARWLLNRLAEDFGIEVSLACKPVKGDWNGAGQHTNVSTRDMRTPGKGLAAIENAIALLEQAHKEHIAVYGHGLEERLTGHHETCSIHQFRSGVAHRGASIRIPRSVADKGCGYLEDRRPGANADPYQISARLIKTICKID